MEERKDRILSIQERMKEVEAFVDAANKYQEEAERTLGRYENELDLIERELASFKDRVVRAQNGLEFVEAESTYGTM